MGKLTGRNYKLFKYHGSPTADRVAICMGSASKTLEETVDYMNQHGENVGLLNVHLFRPWSTRHFLNELPETATKLAVLDKTREDGKMRRHLNSISITMLRYSENLVWLYPNRVTLYSSVLV